MDMKARIPVGLQQYVNELKDNVGRETTQAQKEKLDKILACLHELKTESENMVTREMELRENSLHLLFRLREYETYGPSSAEIPTRFDAEVSQEMRENLINSVRYIRRIMKIMHKIEPRCSGSWPSVERGMKGLKKLLKKVKQLETDAINCWDNLVPDETLN